MLPSPHAIIRFVASVGVTLKFDPPTLVMVTSKFQVKEPTALGVVVNGIPM
jgi:hypothetical protein